MTGLEPVRCHQQGILSPQCLPFHHTGEHRHKVYYHIPIPLSSANFHFSAGIFLPHLHILEKPQRGGVHMVEKRPNEDLDDLIFGEEEWSASER